MRHIKTGFWPARRIASLKDLDEQYVDWRDRVCNCRLHATGRFRVHERLAEERAALRPLPPARFDHAYARERRVPLDGYLRYRGCFYRAPEALVHRRVTPRADRNCVWIAHRGAEVARYPRSYEPGNWQPAPRLRPEPPPAAAPGRIPVAADGRPAPGAVDSMGTYVRDRPRNRLLAVQACARARKLPVPPRPEEDQLIEPIARKDLTGRSRVAAIDGLDHLAKADVLTRHRNQRRGDSWEAKELFALLDKFEAGVKTP